MHVLIGIFFVAVLLGVVNGSCSQRSGESAAMRQAEEEAAEVRKKNGAAFQRDRVAIVAAMKSLVGDGKYDEAIAYDQKYYGRGNDEEADALLRRAREMKYLDELKGVPAKEIGRRAGLYDQLALLDPANRHYVAKRDELNRQLAQRAAAEARVEARRVAAERRKKGVTLGMTKDEVLASSWGRPQHINRTVNVYGVHEQWVYGGHNYLYFDNGVLTSFQN